jgi:superfamily II DNA helicase RecQ
MENTNFFPYRAIAQQAMISVWNRTPRDFQNEAIPRLLMMRCVPNTPSAMLLVQGTGGGKSAVPQTVGAVTCGVTLIIENTLSLSADQHSKIKHANPGHGAIKSFHLDSIRSERNQQKLSKLLEHLPPNSDATIFLFSSPEFLLKEPWKTCIQSLIKKNTLRLVCIDEVHQFVMFGCTFRPTFGLLKESLFRYLICNNNNSTSSTTSTLAVKLKVPLLLMTATFNVELLNILHSMIGIRVSPEMFLWSGRDAMQRRTVRISVSMSMQYLKLIKEILKNILADNTSKKVIIYTNTASRAELIKDEIDSWLNLTSSFEGDTIMINGDMESEVKLLSATTFTADIRNPQHLIDNNKFYPRVLIATSSCIGAGLDSSSVFSVIRVGFPTSVLDMIQEMGRCGRSRHGDGTNPTDDFYLFLSLQDFIYLNERLYDTIEDDVRNDSARVIDYESQRLLQRRNLLKVVSLIYLNTNCWHTMLETEAGSPLEPPSTNSNTCNKACPCCLLQMKEYIMPVSKIGLSRFLAHTFINSSGIDLSPMNIVKLLHDFPNVGQVVYSRPRSVTAPENKYLQSTILQLIASGLIQLKLSDSEPKAQCCLSICDTDSSPTYLDNNYWRNFLLI